MVTIFLNVKYYFFLLRHFILRSSSSIKTVSGSILVYANSVVKNYNGKVRALKGEIPM